MSGRAGGATDARGSRPVVTADVAVALDALRRGGLVAIPTETVYGLGADASDRDAVGRIFAAKGRPSDHPLIVHIADASAMARWAVDLSPAARLLAAACWPGPLTLLVRRAAHVLDVVTGGRPTVALRVPAHPMTLDLLARFAGGIAAPSANRFGSVSPTTAAHVVDDLDGAVDVVLDGGPCPIGVESTIVDTTVDPPQVLRPGGIPDEVVAELLGGHLSGAAGERRAPGMLTSHYAPRARVVLAHDEAEALALLAHHPGAVLIDRSADLVAYARALYADLRAADAAGSAVVVAVLPRAEGLGHAIRDRLTKAAAGR